MASKSITIGEKVSWINDGKGQDYEGIVLAVFPETKSLAVAWIGAKSNKRKVQETPMDQCKLVTAETATA